MSPIKNAPRLASRGAFRFYKLIVLFGKAFAAGALFVAATYLNFVERAVNAFGIVLAVSNVASHAFVNHVRHGTPPSNNCAQTAPYYAPAAKICAAAGIDKLSRLGYNI